MLLSGGGGGGDVCISIFIVLVAVFLLSACVKVVKNGVFVPTG